jgi:hypothetical protein
LRSASTRRATARPIENGTFAYIVGTPVETIAKAFGCSLSYPGYLAKRKGHALRGAGAAWKRQAEGRERWQLRSLTKNDDWVS